MWKPKNIQAYLCISSNPKLTNNKPQNDVRVVIKKTVLNSSDVHTKHKNNKTS